MHFIGIFANNIEFEDIKRHIINSSKRKDLKIININEKNIENMKNIVFETIVLTQKIKLNDIQKNILEKICDNCKYVIINSDICADIKIKANKLINCITYGLNQKSTITISSVQDEKAIVYIQRNINNIEGKKIEMGESSINIPKDKCLKIENILAIFSIFAVYSSQIN